MNDRATGTVFRDAIMLALLGFVAMVVMLIPFINPPTSGDDIPPPGNVIVELRWPDGIDVDVDLWVQGPGDAPVGYSRKSGRLFDLLRDDLGQLRDDTGLNFEFAFSRGAPAGDYTINAHLFSTRGVPPPVAVTMAATIRKDGRSVVAATKSGALEFIGHELTLARFSLDAKGRLVAGSVHQLPKPLRTAGAGP